MVCSWLIDTGLLAAGVLAVSGVVALLLRRAAASTRHLCWGLGLVAAAALFVLTAGPARWQWLSATVVPTPTAVASSVASSFGTSTSIGDVPSTVPVDPRGATTSVVAPEAPGSGADVPAATVGTVASTVAEGTHGPVATRRVEASVSNARPAPATIGTWAPWILAVWAVGVVLSLLPLAFGLWRARAVVGAATPVTGARRAALGRLAGGEDELRATRWASSTAVATPMTLGAFRPMVLLPEAFWSWPEPNQRLVVLHELAHVHRRDWLTRLLARCAVALHWFDPLAWWAERRFVFESECACDDAVLRKGGDACDYAGGLLAIARTFKGGRAPLALAVAGSGGSQLERRIRAMLDPYRGRQGVGPRRHLLLVAVTFAVAVPWAGVGFARRVDRMPVDRPLVVARDGSGDFTSIQAAVDAAAPGATVKITAGTYRERVTIGKPLTLEGAGFATTLLTTDYADPLEHDADLREQLAAAVQAAGKDAGAVRARFLREHGPQPTLAIRDAAGVAVRGFKITQPLAAGQRMDEGRVASGEIVDVDGAGVELTDCAVVGTPASGLTIRGAAAVVVRGCLVAAVGATGIQVASKEAKVEVRGCDLRSCRHRGITVAAGNATTTIARCRISGSLWHGIRYDDAKPLVEANLIFDNERSGIYASGKSEGVVRGNVFWRNAMSGVSCWFASRDQIVGNTFAGEHREGVAVVGAAAPHVANNVFADMAVGVTVSNVAGDRPNGIASGEVALVDNVFWRVARRAQWMKAGVGEPQALEVADGHGNRSADPGFAPGSFALAEASPLRAAGVGAAAPMTLTSPFPPQPEEAVVAAQRGDERAQAEDQARAQGAQKRARAWVEAIMQIRDAGQREAALADMARALRGADVAAQEAALVALARTAQVTYDRKPFRELVLPLCRKATGVAQVQAFYALHAVGLAAGDKDLLVAALGQPSRALRGAGLHLLALFSGNDIRGAAAGRALELLADDHLDEVRPGLNGLWGASVAPEVQARLLELARRPELRHEVIYFTLSTLQDKNTEVVTFLVDALGSVHPEDAVRALWGLGQGVAKVDQARVADAVLALLQARNDAGTRESCLRLLAAYASAAHLPALRELAANELLAPAERAGVQRAIEAIEARAGR
ncbi:MAG: M56 family metallopeptidase [Planctomycetota bacterium]